MLWYQFSRCTFAQLTRFYDVCTQWVFPSFQVVKLWDFETGNSVFEFSHAHGGNAITTMTFDSTGRRLITGARDGRLKVWNYNNGHCLKTLERGRQTGGVALPLLVVKCS